MIVNRSTAEEAWKLLQTSAQHPPTGLYGGAMPENEAAVAALYRMAAARTHPDAVGGSVEAFVPVDRAKHILLEWLKKDVPPPVLEAPPCVNCGGKGYVEQKSQRGFKVTTLRVQCRRCNGTGEEGVEHDRGDWG